ncbi:aliphatic sulfonate ABC transporter substrate-binding protein [Chenggangzhangella methanolivorans]|uniref:Putative aliphatic sulfonates-binding protein n=1 Tax=Chenggangzhangella methanolivorans TaxID=1437009 RepID=A0A9E6R9Z6_9HYPH|nr:aliphatic sulfonate ABC transporter substrate-binding protein [Chenggangzhangella methanolivorans]QZO00923.1 aliphatic sulfonate ABC transporter substrate-binding protein [Chenggangzhangella methanolivorans]
MRRAADVTRRFVLLAAGAAFVVPALLHAPEAFGEAPKTVRIGFQRSSTLMSLLKADGSLEKALGERGVAVTWHEFTSGLPMLEALNVGAIDFSADVADTVPVFAQAAGAKIVYVAEEAASPSAQAILVPASSSVASVADLKGKKIAVTKGAGSHYLLLAALAKAGLSIKDVTPAYLTPADGRAALVAGKVDAVVIWDPFIASIQAQTDARVLADGTGLSGYKRYYLATRDFADRGGEALGLIVGRLKAAGEQLKADPRAGAEKLTGLWAMDAASIEKANGRRSYKIGAVTREGLSEQQKIADAFFGEGLFPRKVVTSELAIWTPPSQ